MLAVLYTKCNMIPVHYQTLWPPHDRSLIRMANRLNEVSMSVDVTAQPTISFV